MTTLSQKTVMTVGYIRVSTGKQNPENQRDEICRYAAANSCEIDQWLIEVISGKKEVKGRKLGRLIKRLKKGDTIIVTEISRLSRSLTDIMGVMGLCIGKGVNIYTTKEKYKFDDSLNSKVLCFAFGLVAEIERNLISLRTKEALAARRAEGQKLGRQEGFCPKLSVLHEKKSLIQEMLDNGCSHKQIYTKLKVSKSTFYKFYKDIEFSRKESEQLST